MSVGGLFNHTVRVYREPDALSSRDGMGGVELRPEPVTSGSSSSSCTDSGAGSGYNARPNQNWSGALTDRGPGEQQVTRRHWFLSSGLDVRERDVLKVVAGPETGLLLRVHSVVPVAGRGTRVNHTEVQVEVWNGELAETAVPS